MEGRIPANEGTTFADEQPVVTASTDLERDERLAALLEDLRSEIARKGTKLTSVDLDRASARNDLDAETGALLLISAVRLGLIDEERPPDGLGEDYLKWPLLTPAEETQLARSIEAGEQAKALLPDVADNDVRSGLEKRIKAGDQAFERFVGSNTRLVVSIARRSEGQGLELSDLVQEGVLGLMTAVRKFDWRLGYKFSTYATWWIRQSIGRAIADKGRTIRIPVHAHERMRSIRRAQAKLAGGYQDEPSVVEIAAEVDLDPATVAFFLDLSRDVLSLDAPIDDSGHMLREVIPIGLEPIEETLFAHERAAIVGEVLKAMPPRERDVLVRRYGIGRDHPETLEVIGRDLGLTRERIRQIQVKAERTFKRLLEKHPGSPQI